MIIGAKIGSKSFSHPNKKEAYLKGCKYMAKFVKYTQVYYTVEEQKESEFPTFVFTLYAIRDLTETKARYCTLCKEFHSSFYINEFYNCNTCSLNSFLNREKEALNISRGAFKKRMAIKKQTR